MTQSGQGTCRLSIGASGTRGKLIRGAVLITLETALKDPVETLRQRVAEFGSDPSVFQDTTDPRVKGAGTADLALEAC